MWEQRCRPRLIVRRCARKREKDVEPRPFVQLRREADAAAHALDDIFGDDEAEPSARALLDEVARGLAEGQEHELLLLGRDAFTVVLDGDEDGHRIGGGFRGGEANAYFALGVVGVLDGVVGDVDNALSEAEVVAHEGGTENLGRLDGEGNLDAALRRLLRNVDEVVHELMESEGVVRELDRGVPGFGAGGARRALKLRVVEHLVDEP
mmetsp:Transcript_13865/g.45597  ORF Transcript_13865/g.45597 Transcript_13865/m.45597 type:complete len:208 (+) Transcript_13865:1171-1794(+)